MRLLWPNRCSSLIHLLTFVIRWNKVESQNMISGSHFFMHYSCVCVCAHHCVHLFLFVNLLRKNHAPDVLPFPLAACNVISQSPEGSYTMVIPQQHRNCSFSIIYPVEIDISEFSLGHHNNFPKVNECTDHWFLLNIHFLIFPLCSQFFSSSHFFSQGSANYSGTMEICSAFMYCIWKTSPISLSLL